MLAVQDLLRLDQLGVELVERLWQRLLGAAGV
jgi:hypothetical protein